VTFVTSSWRARFLQGLIDTVQEYAIVSVDEKTIGIYRREAGSEWHQYTYGGDERIELRSVGAGISCGEVFDGID